MTTSKLTLYNGALRLLGERKLASLTEDRPSRRYLDDAWDDGVVDGALEQGFWRFATRSIEATADTAFTATFGYSYRFNKPSDYICTASICTDEFFRAPLHQYSDEAEYWFADYDVLYIQYVSNDTDYGNNLSVWPQTFQKLVQAMLADEIKELVTGNENKYEIVKKALKDAKSDARSKDVMGKPMKFAPSGSWTKARMRGVTTREHG